MAPLMTGQPPAVVVCSRTPKRTRFVSLSASGGERQVDGQHHRLCPMALTALCHSAAVSGQADEVSAPRGGGIPPGSGRLKPNSSASLSLCCFLGARVLAKPLQQVSSLGQLV